METFRIVQENLVSARADRLGAPETAGRPASMRILLLRFVRTAVLATLLGASASGTATAQNLEFLDFANVNNFLNTVRRDYAKRVANPGVAVSVKWLDHSLEALQLVLWQNVEAPASRRAVFAPPSFASTSSTSTSFTSTSATALPREAWRNIRLDRVGAEPGALDAARTAFPNTFTGADRVKDLRQLSTVCNWLADLGEEYRQRNPEWRDATNEQVFRDVQRRAANDPFTLEAPAPGAPPEAKNVQTYLDQVDRVIGLIEQKASRDIPAYAGHFAVPLEQRWAAYTAFAALVPANTVVDPAAFVASRPIPNDILVRYGDRRVPGIKTREEVRVEARAAEARAAGAKVPPRE